MNDSSHDYSRHTEADLRDQIAWIDPAKLPQRAKSLMLELHRRMLMSEELSKTASASMATGGGGARFADLDSRSAQRFFWPFFGFSFIFSFVAGFASAVLATVVATLIGRFGQPPLESQTTLQVVQITLALALAVPLAKLWTRQVTKRWFGGFGLRIVSANRRPTCSG